ncbi:MAG TPA: dihydrolipoamide acetyltransferase family protein [Vicinamibacterales bacterium]|nr:dihydrolipoamide acetyltransferase family protein [Vicinamibacterales bacterium]
MPTPVLMPQMGESIAEGTIVRWIKKVGDVVQRDEPLFEISTDKVDAEIPSPGSGILSEIRVKEGETVAVNSVVATIAEAGEEAVAEPAAWAGEGAAAPHVPQAAPQADGSPSPKSRPADTAPAARPAAGVEAVSRPSSTPSKEEARRAKSSPLVRRIAREHHVDIRAIQGSGIGGRVTKHDILDYLRRRPEREAGVAARPAPQVPPEVVFRPGESTATVPMSVMRKIIAERMVASRRTSAHVHTVFEVNYGRVEKLREQHRAEYEKAGAKLTYLAFITRAVVDALQAMPVLNASIDGDNIVYKKDINIGIAVALDRGLIVPVIHHAEEKSLLGLCRAIADLAARARAKQLKPEEVQDGTFTITNPGGAGAQFGLPIINQPQVAILGVGTIEKRVTVVDDAIAIRPKGYLALGFDHRLIDGATADRFMALVKHRLENFEDCPV